MRVLKQAGAPYGQRPVYYLKKSHKIFTQTIRQSSLKESCKYLGIGSITQSQRIQVVGRHEFVKNIGAYHNRAWYRNRDSVKIVEYRMLLDNRINKSKATAFAAKRSLSDTGEIGIMVKPVLSEYSYHSTVFHLAVFHHKIEYKLFDCRRLLYGCEFMGSQNFGDRKHRT